jgi:isopenicillin-N N-acyltransferase-like protein
LLSAFLAEYCLGGQNPYGVANTHPIITAPQLFLRYITNGRLYDVDIGNNVVTILHVWGTPYEMGFAHGRLLQAEVTEFITSTYDYMIDEITHEINDFAPNLPPEFVEDVAKLGINGALDKTINITAPYTPDYFNTEIRGLSDASGVDFDMIQRIHMLGELTKGSCSMFGAWDEALASGNGLLQMRTLDWDMSGPFRDHPHITIYHPNDGNDFVNLGWPGWVGSLTGMNDQQMAISEIGASYADKTFGRESRSGIPFTYILRDVLQFDQSLDDSKMRLKQADRTCNLILGVGDGKDHMFNSVRYSYSAADFFDDKTLEPGPWCTEPRPCDWQPLIDNVVYHGMDWNCPTYTQFLGEQLQKHWGKITPELAISEIMAKTTSGDVHNAVYDLTKNHFYFAVAGPHGSSSSEKQAYKNPYYKLDMNKLFAEEKPTLLR